MRRIGKTVFLPLLILVLVIGVYYWLPEPIAGTGHKTMIDARGDIVQLPSHPQKVMATSSALDIVLLEFLPAEKILAVNKDTQNAFSSLRWERAKKIKNNYGRTPGAEEIISLQPDLVFMPDYTSDDIVSGVRAMGVPVVVIKTPKKVEDVHVMIQQVGEALSDSQKAEEMMHRFDEHITAILARSETIPSDQRRKVIFISSMTGYGGTDSLFADANRYAGLINAAEAAGIPAHTAFSEERMVMMNPDIILIPSYSNKTPALVEHYYHDPALASLNAVIYHRVIPLRAAYLYNSSTTLPDGIEAVQSVGYAERFPELAQKYTQPVP